MRSFLSPQVCAEIACQIWLETAEHREQRHMLCKERKGEKKQVPPLWLAPAICSSVYSCHFLKKSLNMGFLML